MSLSENLKFSIRCKCGGSISFSVQSANYDKQYVCPNCSTDLTHEISPLIVNVKESLQHHCEYCQSFNNVNFVQLTGKLL